MLADPAQRRESEWSARLASAVEVVRLPGSPVWAALANLKPGVAGLEPVSCCGTGLSAAQARQRCVGEMAERASAVARATDAVAWGEAGRLSGEALPLQELLGFAPEQVEHRGRIDDAALAWVAVDAVTGVRRRLVPAALCYDEAPPSWCPSPFPIGAGSRGCAAGATREQALAAALLELIEHDATGIWWYAACPRPSPVFQRSVEPELAELLGWRSRHPRPSWLLDLTHDLGVPVVAALSSEADGRLVALGVAARPTVQDAAAAALRELAQSELGIHLFFQRRTQRAIEPSAADRRLALWLRSVTTGNMPALRPTSDPAETGGAGAAHPPCRDAAGCAADSLARAGIEAWWLDLTREDIGVPVVRVLAPGSCHVQPRLGLARLTEVPVRLGWRPPGFGRRDLNHFPLLV
jgi:ribosomal protein S12 methylthiotransferase accessory factor